VIATVGKRIAAVICLSLVGWPSPAAADQPAVADFDAAGCRRIADGTGRSSDRHVAWRLVADPKQRRRLDVLCGTVGPIVVHEPAAASEGPSRPTTTALAIVGWNVHVGGGHLHSLIDRLTSGQLTGTPVTHFVLLLQEAYRSSPHLPHVPPDVQVPRRIAPHGRAHPPADIVDVARARGLHLFYAPSMRNGRDSPGEDRGNAIVSTLPLSGLTAIELPFTRQRRLALAASVRTADGDSSATLAVVSAHFDALAGASRLWIFATGWRGHQAKTLLDALDPAGPMALSADLNTWMGGTWESAYRRLDGVFDEPPPACAGCSVHGRLDYVFQRLPPGIAAAGVRLPDRFGSDHRPIVVLLRLRAV
jgi:endonuclease/exonuclease/phosphatase family metal-dependent hydrolase